MNNMIARLIRHYATLRQWASAGGDVQSSLLLAMLGHTRMRRFCSTRLSFRAKLAGDSLVNIDASSADHRIIVQEVLVEGLYDLGLVPFTPDIVVDCGAHIGLFTRVAAATYPNAFLHAFEPNPGNLAWLRKQVEADEDRIEVLAAAVDDYEGRAVLFGDGCGGTLFASDSHEAVLSREVPVVRLRRWLEENLQGAPRLLLKIDIEGREFALIPDILPVLPFSTTILIEAHSYGGDEAVLVDLLERAGFSLVVLRTRVTVGVKYTEYLAFRMHAKVS